LHRVQLAESRLNLIDCAAQFSKLGSGPCAANLSGGILQWDAFFGAKLHRAFTDFRNLPKISAKTVHGHPMRQRHCNLKRLIEPVRKSCGLL
jgi:hypothetical protein